ncbi:microspherule protein 1 [Episyrphus balteatus]|uniref:microspherule protein 1 n=1 Tax=Episyrphus balteatus TaxID=286459 RepID=UPI0024853FA6|nr:microspherule protein 1 [Episyrphus balteatus]
METSSEPTKSDISKVFSSSMQNLPIEIQNDQKRRSSSRSIKRKRFDDEIVEYSIGFPQSQQSRFGRPRTQSQSYVTTVASQVDPTTATAITVQAPSGDTPPQTISVNAPNLPTTTTIMPLPGQHIADKRKALKAGKKSKKPGRPPNQIATKDLGRWKPIDDLALIIGIQQTNDLRTVHRGTKFSCKFTLQEMQARWYTLLYEEPISRIAVAAMRNLHPESVESVQSRALYTVQEEEILGTIKSTDNPKLETFQELLDKNASIFFSARTAKALQNHWQLMKQYQLLPDQVVKPLFNEDQPLSFSDAEELILDSELIDNKDDAVEIELALADRRNKREIRQLENELGRWNVLVDSLTGAGVTPEFDGQTLAILRGRLVRYLMRSKEITFGRDAKEVVVDVDLSLEGPACKVSRKQGTIKLRSNGDFFISNEGKRPIFIDGSPLLCGNKTRLANNCVVEIAGLRFVFLVNYDLINAIRHESAKTNTTLN